MSFHRLSILGVGLLGGSIGLAVQSAASACHVVGYGHRKSTLDRALEIGAIDEAFDNTADAVLGADLVILATPVGLLESTLQAIAPHLATGAVVTDVGSTKRSIVEAAGRLLPSHAHFVGSHPMAGSEKRGIEYARTDLFQQATCIVTPDAQTNPASLQKVEAFWQMLGMRITRLSPEAHDQALADVSHLPHAVAAAIVAMQDEAALPLAGKGFLDATRIAGGDGALWRDILHDNRDNMRASLLRLKGELDYIIDLLDPSRAEELRQWLDQAASRREALLKKKLGEVTPD